MDEKFTKKLRDVLNNPPEVPYDEAGWLALNKRLDEKPRRWYGGLIYWIPAACLLWLLPYWFSWNASDKLDKANARIEQLESLVQSNNSVSTDTILQTHETMVYDTIYRTVYITEKSGKNTNASVNSPVNPFWASAQFNSPLYRKHQRPTYSAGNTALPNVYYSLEHPFVPINDQAPSSLLGLASNLVTGGAGKGNVSQPPIDLGVPGELELLPMRLLAYSNNPDLELALTPLAVKEHKKGLRYYLYKMQPERVGLGTNVGPLITSFGTGRGINFIGSLEASIGYSTNMDLVFGLEYLQWKFDKNIEKEENETFEYFPEVAPNDPADVLDEVYGDFKYLQIPIGLKYVFNSRKKLEPFFSFGVTAQRSISSQLDYSFLAVNSNYSIYKNNILSQNFELKALWGSLGFQYVLNDNWVASLEGGGQFGLGSTRYKYENLQLFKIEAGVKYLF